MVRCDAAVTVLRFSQVFSRVEPLLTGRVGSSHPTQPATTLSCPHLPRPGPRDLYLFSNLIHPDPLCFPGSLQLSEVRWASLHVEETLRMSALSLLCTDLRMTTVPPAAEMDLLREVRAAVTFPASSHGIAAVSCVQPVVPWSNISAGASVSLVFSAILCWQSLYGRAAGTLLAAHLRIGNG